MPIFVFKSALRITQSTQNGSYGNVGLILALVHSIDCSNILRNDMLTLRSVSNQLVELDKKAICFEVGIDLRRRVKLLILGFLVVLDLTVLLGAHTTRTATVVQKTVNNTVSAQVVLLAYVVPVDRSSNTAEEEGHQTSHHTSITVHLVLVFAVDY
jgi:hypothetical protein